MWLRRTGPTGAAYVGDSPTLKPEGVRPLAGPCLAQSSLGSRPGQMPSSQPPAPAPSPEPTLFRAVEPGPLLPSLDRLHWGNQAELSGLFPQAPGPAGCWHTAWPDLGAGVFCACGNSSPSGFLTPELLGQKTTGAASQAGSGQSRLWKGAGAPAPPVSPLPLLARRAPCALFLTPTKGFGGGKANCQHRDSSSSCSLPHGARCPQSACPRGPTWGRGWCRGGALRSNQGQTRLGLTLTCAPSSPRHQQQRGLFLWTPLPGILQEIPKIHKRILNPGAFSSMAHLSEGLASDDSEAKPRHHIYL